MNSVKTISPGTLSVCMIVKNESATLARCLESIVDCADEIIVVDTGSSDDTVAIAKQFDAVVIQSDWRNDFAYSRNISIQNASCAWILWLDGDDVVPAASISLINAMKKQNEQVVYGFVVKNEKPGNTGSEFMQARMFPNRKDLYFERRIHEQMMLSALRAGLHMEETKAVIEHHGYEDPQTVLKKAKRNVDLLLAEWKDEPPDIVRAIEIADSFYNLGNMEDAKTWYNTVLALPGCKTQMPQIASQAYLGLGNIANKEEAYTRATDYFRESLLFCKGRVDVLFSLAVTLDMTGNLAAAKEMLYSVIDNKSSTLLVSVDHREAALKAYLRLERILLDLNQKQELTGIAEKAIHDFPERPELLNMAARAFFINQKYADSLHTFEKSLSYNTDMNCEAYIGLCHIYCLAGRKEHAFSTMENIKELFSLKPMFWAYFIKLNGEDGRKEIPEAVLQGDVDRELKNLERVFGK